MGKGTTDEAGTAGADTNTSENKDVLADKLTGIKRFNNAMDEHLALHPGKKECLEGLRKLQTEHFVLEEHYRREWNALKLKYLKLFQPLYEDRFKLLTETSAAKASTTAEESTEANIGDTTEAKIEGTPQLPNFWLKALQNHVMLAEMIEPADVPILQYLRDIRFEWLNPAEQMSFSITFLFAPNPHFEPNEIKKTYCLERADDDDDESILTKTEGTKIEWKEGKDVTKKVVVKKQRHKTTHQTRTVTRTEEASSFFNFFQSHEIPNEEQLERMDDREVGELEMIVEAEFEVGCILRDKIIPRATGWYLGCEKNEEAEQSEFSEDDENDNEEDAEDSDE